MAKAPVFQVYKLDANRNKHFDYRVGLADARQAESQGWVIDCVAFIADDAAGTDLTEFQRWESGSDHYFSTAPQGTGGWNYRPLTPRPYLRSTDLSQPQGHTALLAYRQSISNNWSHFYTANPSTNPPPAGYSTMPSNKTGWTPIPTIVNFKVAYDRTKPVGQQVTVTGGNAVGQTVRVDGQDYVLKADDALVQFGMGNWVCYQIDGTPDRWHLQDISVSAGANGQQASVTKVTFANDDNRIALIDDDGDCDPQNHGYEYTLTIHDEVSDVSVPHDPKLINRSSSVPGPIVPINP